MESNDKKENLKDGEFAMALSISSNPAVRVDSQPVSQDFSRSFSEGLGKLSSRLLKSGVGARPAEYGEQFEQRVKAAELSKSVRNANDSVAEARTASEGLGRVEELLGEARSLAFGAINKPGQREREQDQIEYSKKLRDIDAIASNVVFGGGPLLEASASFGASGGLSKVDLSSFQGSIGAIQVIDRAIVEVTDQRGLLGIFQTSKLSSIGNLLRGGVGGLVSSTAVVRDRVVAVNLATSAVAKLGEETGSSVLSSNTAAARILESFVGRL